jgi:hypothetical protein
VTGQFRLRAADPCPHDTDEGRTMEILQQLDAARARRDAPAGNRELLSGVEAAA